MEEATEITREDIIKGDKPFWRRPRDKSHPKGIKATPLWIQLLPNYYDIAYLILAVIFYLGATVGEGQTEIPKIPGVAYFLIAIVTLEKLSLIPYFKKLANRVKEKLQTLVSSRLPRKVRER